MGNIHEIANFLWSIADEMYLLIKIKKRARPARWDMRSISTEQPTGYLLKDIRKLIESTRSQVAQVVNTGLVMLFKDPLQREFYTELCRIERWSVRTLFPEKFPTSESSGGRNTPMAPC